MQLQVLEEKHGLSAVAKLGIVESSFKYRSIENYIYLYIIKIIFIYIRLKYMLINPF